MNKDWKGFKRKVKRGRVLVYIPDHPQATKDGYVRRSRLVMEDFVRRPLTKDEVVHHRNRDKQDDRIENLRLMLNADHSRYHARRTMVLLECECCGTKFLRQPSEVAAKKRAGQVHFFCGPACVGEHSRSGFNRMELLYQELVADMPAAPSHNSAGAEVDEPVLVGSKKQ